MPDWATHAPVGLAILVTLWTTSLVHGVELLPKDGNTVQLTAVIQLLTTNPPGRVLALASEILIVDSD